MVQGVLSGHGWVTFCRNMLSWSSWIRQKNKDVLEFLLHILVPISTLYRSSNTHPTPPHPHNIYIHEFALKKKEINVMEAWWDDIWKLGYQLMILGLEYSCCLQKWARPTWPLYGLCVYLGNILCFQSDTWSVMHALFNDEKLWTKSKDEK